MDLIANRTMGVVPKARSEQGNYVSFILPERYNDFLFIDQARPLALLSGMPGGRNVLLMDSDNKSEAGKYSHL